MRSVTQPLKRRRRNRDGAGQTAAVLVIGAALAAALFAGGKYVVMRTPAVPLPVRVATAKPAVSQGGVRVTTAASNDEIYTGSILYMPFEGRVCHQLLFDNRNGNFTDNGTVDCLSAAYEGEDGVPRQWSSARARVISMAFRKTLGP